MRKIYVATDLMESQDVEEIVPKTWTKEQISMFLNNKYGQNGWLAFDDNPFNDIEDDQV
jgi:hypothetical protein